MLLHLSTSAASNFLPCSPISAAAFPSIFRLLPPHFSLSPGCFSPPLLACSYLPIAACPYPFFTPAPPKNLAFLSRIFPVPSSFFSDLARLFRSFFPCKTGSSSPYFPRAPSSISYSDSPAFFADCFQNLAASPPVFYFPTRPFRCFLFTFLPVLPARFSPAWPVNLSQKTYPLLCLLLPGRPSFQPLPTYPSS